MVEGKVQVGGASEVEGPKEIKGAATVEGARVPPRWRETSKIKVQIGGQSPKCQSGWKGELGQVRERELDE